jgi:hypothetical protein
MDSAWIILREDLLSYFSKYLCLFVFIRGFPYPLFSFLFPIFVKRFRALNR